MNTEFDLVLLNTQHSSTLERTLISILMKFRRGKVDSSLSPMEIPKVTIYSLDILCMIVNLMSLIIKLSFLWYYLAQSTLYKRVRICSMDACLNTNSPLWSLILSRGKSAMLFVRAIVI